MNNNDVPSISDAIETEIPSDADIMAALGGGSPDDTGIEAQDSQTTDIIEESGDLAETLDEPTKNPEFKSILDAAKEELDDKEAKTEEVEESLEAVEPSETEGAEKEAESKTEEFEVTIDGQVETVSLQDLKNDYSGRTAVARRFTELDKKEKQLYNDKSKIEGYVNGFSEKIQNGDALGAFTYLAEFASIPPYLLKEQLVAAIRPEVERRYALNEQEQQKELLSAELEHMKSQKESETKRQEAEQTLQELQLSVNSVRETHKITEDVWNEAFAILDKEIPATENISIEQVTTKSLDIKADNLTTTILSEFKEVPGDAKSALKNVILQNPSFTEEDLRDIVAKGLEEAKKAADEAKAQEMGKKLKSKVKTTKATVTPKQNQQQTSQINGVDVSVIEDWDDIL